MYEKEEDRGLHSQRDPVRLGPRGEGGGGFNSIYAAAPE